MKYARKIVLVFLFVVAHAHAASFDCAQAQSVQENLICDNEELSNLDTQLGVVYDAVRKDMTGDEAQRLAVAQRLWLRNVRNRCNDLACLLSAYQDRINQVNPVADNKITCAKMQKFPTEIFSYPLDLGSGSYSAIEVDYQCQGSLRQLPETRKLVDMGEKIRAQSGPQECTGTIIYAIWRYYYFSLAEAGFAPKNLLQTPTTLHAGMDWRTISQTDESAEDGRLFRYFKQWSEESQYNLSAYDAFTAEFDRTLPALAAYYENKFGLSNPDAQIAAKRALMRIVKRAAGSFPASELQPISDLAKLARDKQSTPEAFHHLLDVDGGKYSEADVYQALNIALINNRSLAIVAPLAERLPEDAWIRLGQGEESLLSVAIGNQQNLEYLLKRKLPVDAANGFGKTALFYAIGSNDHEAVATLLRFGANVNHPYKSAEELRPESDKCTYYAINHTRRTPLMHAAQHSDVAMLKMLIQAGADPNAADEVGYNALDYARDAKNHDNEIYLKSLNLSMGAPRYTAEMDSSVREHEIERTVLLDGDVSKLVMAPGRRDILFAAVGPWDTLKAGPEHGLYLFSINAPDRPVRISQVGGISVQDFAVSPDGTRVYVMEMGYEKVPGKKFGISVIDTTNAAKPKLVGLIEGDFMTMKLSVDGNLLYLQERKLNPEFSRGLLVYGVGAGEMKLKCSNPFGKPDDIWGPIFAYEFASFPDEPLLLIHDSRSRVLLFDVTDSCAPKELAVAQPDKFIGPLFARANRTIVSGTDGLQMFHITESLQRVTRYQATITQFQVNVATGSTVAVIGKDVAVFRLKPNGQFMLTDRFRPQVDNIGSVLQDDTGRIYFGWNGGLGVGRISGK